MWIIAVGFLLLLLIPLAAIVLDSDVGRALARRLGGTGDGEGGARVKELEKEVQYLSETVQSLQEETRFIRELLERPRPQESLPPGED